VDESTLSASYKRNESSTALLENFGQQSAAMVVSLALLYAPSLQRPPERARGLFIEARAALGGNGCYL
jgi:hypothetical protein